MIYVFKKDNGKWRCVGKCHFFVFKAVVCLLVDDYLLLDIQKQTGFTFEVKSDGTATRKPSDMQIFQKNKSLILSAKKHLKGGI